MLDTIPAAEEMTALVGKPLYDVWTALCALIEEKYDMDRLWDKGGKAWKYEYKPGRQDAVRAVRKGRLRGLYGHPGKGRAAEI